MELSALRDKDEKTIVSHRWNPIHSFNYLATEGCVRLHLINMNVVNINIVLSVPNKYEIESEIFPVGLTLMLSVGFATSFPFSVEYSPNSGVNQAKRLLNSLWGTSEFSMSE